MTDEAAAIPCPMCNHPLEWKTIKVIQLTNVFKLWCSHCRCFPEVTIDTRSK